MDEIGTSLDLSKTTGIVEKGQRDARIQVSGNREHCTMLAHIKADGTAYPPCLIFKGKKVQADILAEAPEGVTVWCQKNAWMEGDAFHEYITENWYPKVSQEVNISEAEPVVLIYDGHKSHIKTETIEFAMAHHIIILTLWPHSSHICQPLDVSVFGPLKTAFRNLYR